MAAIELRELRVVPPPSARRGPLAIAGTLTLADGDCHVLFGGVGSGKSTLLDLLAGTLRADSGSVRFDGVDVTQRPLRERRVALVARAPVVYPHLSVRGNLEVPLRAGRRRQPTVSLSRVADLIGLQAILERRAGSLAPAQQQRVAIARAMLRPDADVVLLDEPLALLQPSERSDLRCRLALARRELGRTVVLATQDSADALTLGDRILALDGGRVVQDASQPRDVLARPATVGVARCVGDPPMNLLPCRVRGRWAVVDGFRLPLAFTPVVPADAETRLGVRADDLRLVDRPDDALGVDVLAVEDQGRHQLVRAALGGGELLVVLPERPVMHAGVRCHFGVDPARLVVFADGARVDG